MALETELKTYKRELPNLLGSEGKYVVIRGEEIADVFETYDDALKFAYKSFGVDSLFMVKRIAAMEPISYVHRAVSPKLCHQ